MALVPIFPPARDDLWNNSAPSLGVRPAGKSPQTLAHTLLVLRETMAASVRHRVSAWRQAGAGRSFCRWRRFQQGRRDLNQHSADTARWLLVKTREAVAGKETFPDPEKGQAREKPARRATLACRAGRWRRDEGQREIRSDCAESTSRERPRRTAVDPIASGSILITRCYWSHRNTGHIPSVRVAASISTYPLAATTTIRRAYVSGSPSRPPAAR
jgi:hypothetical protein